MGKKVKELPNIMSLNTKTPKIKKDEIPHWRVWLWALRHPNESWKR